MITSLKLLQDDKWNQACDTVSSIFHHWDMIPDTHSLNETFNFAHHFGDWVCDRLAPRQEQHGEQTWQKKPAVYMAVRKLKEKKKWRNQGGKGTTQWHGFYSRATPLNSTFNHELINGLIHWWLHHLHDSVSFQELHPATQETFGRFVDLNYKEDSKIGEPKETK